MSEHAKKPSPMGSLPTMGEIESLPDRQQVGRPVTRSVSAGWSGRKPVNKEVEAPPRDVHKPR